jgi:signal transduction histidine kinase
MLLRYLLICLLSTAVSASASTPDVILLEKKLQDKHLPIPDRIWTLNLISRDLSFVDPVRSISLANEALRLSTETADLTGMAYAYRNISNVHSHNENYYAGIDYLQRALDIFTDTQDSSGIGNCYISLGHLYNGLNMKEQALEYHRKSFELFSRLNITERIGVSAHNLGESYFETGKWSMCEKVTRYAIKVNDSIHNTSVLSACYKVMGMLEHARDNNDMAEAYFKKVLALSDELGPKSQKMATVNSLIQLAMLQRLRGNDVEQLDYLKKAAEVCQQYNLSKHMEQVYRELILYFSIRNNTAEVQRYMKDYDAAMATSKAKRAEGWSRLVESVIQVHDLEREKKKLEEQNLLQTERIQLRTILLSIAIVSLIVLVWLISKLAWANRTIREANSKLNQQNATIEIQRQNLEELNSTKDKFFGILAHDLKSPLNSLKSFSLLLLSGVDMLGREELLKMGAMLQASVDNTIKMTDNLITWARIQMQSYQVQPQAVSVREVAEEVCLLYKEIATSKKITLVNDVPDSAWVYTDKDQIMFVIRNLVNNAIKFSHNGGQVRITSAALSGGEVEVAIADNGIGIPDEAMKHLFSLGKPRSTTGTGGEKGTGLGLVLSFEFVKLNKGTIHFESHEGKGTTFRIRLVPASPEQFLAVAT